MQDEVYEHLHSERENADREKRDTQKYDHDDNVETTYERAAREVAEDEAQADYEREDKMGII